MIKAAVAKIKNLFACLPDIQVRLLPLQNEFDHVVIVIVSSFNNLIFLNNAYSDNLSRFLREAIS